MVDKAKQDLWRQRVADFLATGDSRRAWCEKHQLPLHQLGYWLRKFHGDGAGPSRQKWIALERIRPIRAGVSLRVGSLNLDVEPGFDEQVLEGVIRALMVVC